MVCNSVRVKIKYKDRNVGIDVCMQTWYTAQKNEKNILKTHLISIGKRKPAGTPLRSDRAITGNLAASAGPKHNVPEVFYWIWSVGQSVVSIPISSILLHTLTKKGLGIVVYQEEHRTHCTNIESDNGLSIKDLISRPKGSQGAVS